MELPQLVDLTKQERDGLINTAANSAPTPTLTADTTDIEINLLGAHALRAILVGQFHHDAQIIGERRISQLITNVREERDNLIEESKSVESILATQKRATTQTLADVIRTACGVDGLTTADAIAAQMDELAQVLHLDGHDGAELLNEFVFYLRDN